MFKCAIVGASGGRARGHADAFRFVSRGKLVAVSSRNREKLDGFADEFGIEHRYTEYREMFEKQKPDLVFVNTPPDVRLEVIEAADAAGIPALIIEKPLAIEGEDFRAIRAYTKAASPTGPKIAINHQLHFHPRRQFLQKLVREGGIGEILFVEASSGMNLAYQGTHSLQAISAFLPDHRPVSVFGQVSGADGLADTPKKHFAPDESLASIKYLDADGGSVDAVLRCGANAPRVGDGPINTHKRIAVYGTDGSVRWSMWSWQSLVRGKRDGGEHLYPEEDVRGQAAMTEAMFDWIDDANVVHPLNIESALRDCNIILGLYESALGRRVVELPVEPGDGLVGRLRSVLKQNP
ncbi:MAG: gfo/Idh/MocA family oxidoreductase [Spirochaetaceae bacterium]|nr:MAG: gfo/Idh/MocA family oxidoreductase [Spirochaetaceae bacterium]